MTSATVKGVPMGIKQMDDKLVSQQLSCPLPTYSVHLSVLGGPPSGKSQKKLSFMFGGSLVKNIS